MIKKLKSCLELWTIQVPFDGLMRSKRTRHGTRFPEGALQHIFDDSWRSNGQRPELFELVRPSFQGARSKL